MQASSWADGWDLRQDGPEGRREIWDLGGEDLKDSEDLLQGYFLGGNEQLFIHSERFLSSKQGARVLLSRLFWGGAA